MKRAILALLTASFVAAPAQAILIRYDFAGTLTAAGPSLFSTEAGFVGDAGSYSGHIDFDTNAPDQDVGAAELYSPGEFLLTIGSYTFSSSNLGFDSAAASIDPAAPGSFLLNFQSTRDFSALDTGEFLNFSISFPGAVPGPVQTPDVTMGIAELTLFGGSDLLAASGDVTQIDVVTAIPEPASWAMMIAGFGLIGGALRRRPMRKVRVAI